MMWSDMFFRMSNNGEYYDRKVNLPQEAIAGVPDVDLVYWDYYHTQKADYRAMIEAHEKIGKDVWFAGGAWTWVGFTPANRYTLQTMKPAMDVCRERGVRNIFFTVWGDDGKECSYFTILPSLYYLKRYYDGVTNRKQIAQEFEKLTGEPFERMMNMDDPNYVGGNKEGFRNPSKYMLYNDPFFGWLDTQVKEGVDKEYKTLARKFTNYAKQSENFGYIYDVYAKLCRVLAYKYDLGVRVRESYQVRDETKNERNFLRSFFIILFGCSFRLLLWRSFVFLFFVLVFRVYNFKSLDKEGRYGEGGLYDDDKKQYLL